MLRFCTLLSSLLSLLFLHPDARASHCAGGEIHYQWVSDSTYHVTFKLYRDCSGNTAPNNVQLSYKSTCDNICNNVTLLPSVTLPGGGANGTPVSSGCAGYPGKCQSASSTLPGYTEWWYEGNVTLPFKCSEWRFSVSISARNVSTNLTGGSNNLFYVEAILNNMLAQGNSSPLFTVKPVPFVCINSPYTYNNGATDFDGDSLAYEIMAPQKGNCSTDGSPITFSNATYNLTTNPIPAGNTFSIDPITGQLSFTPNQLGAATLTLRVKEYRNHVLIGSTMRDIQVQTLNCNTVQPQIGIDTFSIAGAQFSNGRIENCANTPLSFCFKVRSVNNNAVLVASDNHLGVAPGSTMTYTGQGTDSILGCFSWLPTAADTGLKIFTISVKDSTCLPPGIAVSQSFVLPIYIYAVTNIHKDTTVCLGTAVPLSASGGNVFTWTVLPGGSPLSTLSCTNCASPVATPTVTTRYVVTSNLVSLCNKNKDTVTITVNAPPTVQVSSNSPICRGQSLQLSGLGAATNYNWVGPAGFNSVLQSPVIANAQLANSGTYQLIVKNGNCASPPITLTVVVNPAPSAPVVTGTNPVCEGRTLQLTASGSGANAVYYWTGTGFSASGATAAIPFAGPQHAGVYSVKAGFPNNTCLSPATNYTVMVSPKVTAGIHLSRDLICQGDTVSLLYTGVGGLTDSLRWRLDDGVLVSGTGAGPLVVRFPESGKKALALTAASLACQDVVQKELEVVPQPKSTFNVRPDACIGEPFGLEADPALGHDLQFTWSFGGATVIDGSGPGLYHLSYATPGYKVITLVTKDQLCSSEVSRDTVYVHPHPDARIHTAGSTRICASDSVRLEASGQPGYAYQWGPAAYFGDSRAEQTVAIVPVSGYLYLQATDDYGCTAKDSLLMQTQPCCEVYLPTAFSPNGDGRNDLFRIITTGHHLVANFRVINRWGQVVFETANEQRGWDGTMAGRPADGGTYFYYIKYRCSNGQVYEQKGDVVLVR